MGANEQNTQLKDALEALPTLKERGFSSTCGPTGGVVVDRWSHVRGVWHFHVHSFFWTPAGYGEPTYRCSALDEAIQYTLAVISKT